MRLAYLHAEVIDGDGQVVQHQVDAVVVVNLVLEVLGEGHQQQQQRQASNKHRGPRQEAAWSASPAVAAWHRQRMWVPRALGLFGT